MPPHQPFSPPLPQRLISAGDIAASSGAPELCSRTTESKQAPPRRLGSSQALSAALGFNSFMYWLAIVRQQILAPSR